MAESNKLMLTNSGENTLVSIIIPTFNSSGTIGRCLKSILNQTYKSIEVIIVDNYSSDETEKLIEEIIKISKTLSLRFIKFKSGRAKARKLGARFAHGEYLFFLDSDMELSAELLRECINVCKNYKYDALIIPEVNVGENYLARCFDTEKRLYRIGRKGFARFIKKDFYEKIGGHDEHLTARADADLHIRVSRAGARLGYINRPHINHLLGKLTLRNMLNKYYFYHKTALEFNKKYPYLSKLSARVTEFSLRTHFKAFLQDPLGSIGFYFMVLLRFLYATFFALIARAE
jgi:glycosyltransferase involved in cell wall biosynthesis